MVYFSHLLSHWFGHWFSHRFSQSLVTGFAIGLVIVSASFVHSLDGFGFGKKNFGADTDTETDTFSRNSVPIPNFGRTLARAPSSYVHRVTSEVAHVSFLPEVIAQI